MNVSTRDKDTGTEQRITISESSNLDQSEVERMVADAERNRAEDARVRELVDARNQLDSAAYQVERRLSELGDAVPEHERARAQMLVDDARQAVKEEGAPLDRLRSLAADLQQVYQGLGVAAQSTGQPGQPGQSNQGSSQAVGGSADDDVIDAEFTSG